MLTTKQREIEAVEVIDEMLAHWQTNKNTTNHGIRALSHVVKTHESNLVNARAGRRRISDDALCRWATRLDALHPWPDCYPLQLARRASGLSAAQVAERLRDRSLAAGEPVEHANRYTARWVRRREHVGGWPHCDMCAYLAIVEAPSLLWQHYADPHNHRPRGPRAFVWSEE